MDQKRDIIGRFAQTFRSEPSLFIESQDILEVASSVRRNLRAAQDRGELPPEATFIVETTKDNRIHVRVEGLPDESMWERNSDQDSWKKYLPTAAHTYIEQYVMRHLKEYPCFQYGSLTVETDLDRARARQERLLRRLARKGQAATAEEQESYDDAAKVVSRMMDEGRP